MYEVRSCILEYVGSRFEVRKDNSSSRGGIHKKISGLEKKAKKVPRVFFKIGVRGPKQKLGRGADAPPLSANVVDSLLIGNTPLASIACH